MKKKKYSIRVTAVHGEEIQYTVNGKKDPEFWAYAIEDQEGKFYFIHDYQVTYLPKKIPTKPHKLNRVPGRKKTGN